MKIELELTDEQIDRLKSLKNLEGKGDYFDVTLYALLLGLKIIEAGIDSDELIRGLQEPGTGFDLPLMMAKKRTRGEFQSIAEMAIGQSAVNDKIAMESILALDLSAYETNYEFEQD
jgi:hypothetical protein